MQWWSSDPLPPRRRLSTCAWTKATIMRRQERFVKERNYIPHIRRIGEEKLDDAGVKRYPARRWVVERTLGWLSKCRAILVRYDKKASNYLGLIKVACILLCGIGVSIVYPF